MVDKEAQAGPSRRGGGRGGKVGRGGRGGSGGTRFSDESLAKQKDSIARATRIPISLQQTTPSNTLGLRPPKSLGNIKDKKLRAHLAEAHISQVRAAEHAKTVDDYLYAPAPGEDAGLLEAEGDLERTYKVTQTQIRDAVSIDAAGKSFSLDLSGGKKSAGMGPYRSAYTRNGRHLVLGGRKGHLAALDWQTGKLLCEVNVNETVRDVTWLHNHSFFAAAQKKYTYIYDQQGAEVHRLKDHIDVNRLEFLPYHFLLASIGEAGYLKYQDTSTGTLIAEHRTGLGSCSTMAQNPLTAVLHLGHANGTLSLWTPNLSTPALKMLAHRGPVSGISVSAHSGGREMATSGLDGSVKVWDSRMLGRGAVREWQSPRPASDLRYSQRGLLAMAWGTHVSVYDTKRPVASGSAPGPYLNNGFPQGAPIQIAFCPFEDVLGVAHAGGFDSLVVPGSGEARFDSSEADPYESAKMRREREVRSLLDKVQPDTISLDPDMLGQLDVPQADAPREESEDEEERMRIKRRGGKNETPFARMKRIERLRLQGKEDESSKVDQDLGQSSDESEDDESGARDHVKSKSTGWNSAKGPSLDDGKIKEKKKARGRNTTMKRYLKKKRENVVDPQTVAVREKLERLQQEQRDAESGQGQPEAEPSALDVFTKTRKRTRAAR